MTVQQIERVETQGEPRAHQGRRLRDCYRVTEDVLGSGVNGKPCIVICKRTGAEYAMKTIPSLDAKDAKEMTDIELDVFRRGSGNPVIVQAVDVFVESRSVYIVMEKFAGGDLGNYMREHGGLKEGDAASVIRDVALGLRFFHSSGVAHRDVKATNVFCSGPKLFPVKLGDYGYCSGFGRRPCCPDHGRDLFSDQAGTLLFMAPEVRNNSGHYDKQCDMWSLGLLLYHALEGELPFPVKTCNCGKNPCPPCESLLMNFVNGKLDMTGPRWQKISFHAKDLIGKLVVVDPRERLTVEQVLNHPWVKYWTEFTL